MIRLSHTFQSTKGISGLQNAIHSLAYTTEGLSGFFYIYIYTYIIQYIFKYCIQLVFYISIFFKLSYLLLKNLSF